MKFGTARLPNARFLSQSGLPVATPRTGFCGKQAYRKFFKGIAAAALMTFGSFVAIAQDIRGLEICTAEKDMVRRTSCLQSNVELLQQQLNKQTRRAADDRAAAVKELTVLKAEIVGLKILLTRAQDEISSLRKIRSQDQEKNQEKNQEKK